MIVSFRLRRSLRTIGTRISAANAMRTIMITIPGVSIPIVIDLFLSLDSKQEALTISAS